ncbi:MAG: class I SAM-dependent methyltransferase [Magnetococcales bacterium]|nr:class I SAM-dependent methyltransferase [Magnetococcales bacterium]
MTAPARPAGIRRRSDCRLCGSTRLVPVFSLTPTPPANACVPAERVGMPQAKYPLDLFFCADCTHLQLLDVVDPGELFEQYVYVSGTSPVFVEHFRNYAATLGQRYRPPAGGLVVDIGSNDGTLLRCFQEAGHPVLGVDPAREIARRATAAGIETLATFFTPDLARELRRERGPAVIVTANNVFAHADDLAGILDGVRHLLAPGGIFAFEVSYLLEVHRQTLFDTIYHEHLAYHAVRPLLGFLERGGMELIAADPVPTHGGSIRCIAQPRGGPHPVADSVARQLALESAAGLDQAATWIEFGRRIDQLGHELKALLTDLRSRGQRIAGFGAPAKATTLMFHFGLGPESVEFIVDDSPLKQGLFTPGWHIPILPSSAIYERKPDCLLLLAWNFAQPIMAKHQRFQEAGGRFIIPIPKPEIV